MFYKPYNLGWFELHAVDHCNLNCINCNHHSLFFKKKEHNAADYFPHIDEMIRRNIKFNQIGILGGEPFLHSNLFGFVNSIKQRYEKNIVITTNGFWLGKDYSKKNPDATFEFLSKTEDMFYDLTKDDGRDFGKWKTKYPLESCNYCSVWKKNWVSWKNSKSMNKNDRWPKLL